MDQRIYSSISIYLTLVILLCVRPTLVTPSEKLDHFKILLGVAAEDEVEEETPSDAESESEMAIKIEKDELEALMTRAVAAATAAKPVSEAAQGGEINAITVAQPLKIAIFWEDDPDTWFMRLEMQFLTRKITSDKTKFAHVIQTLNRALMKEVKSILRDLPKGTSYPEVKKALIQAFTKTQLERTHLSLIHI